MDFSIPQGTFTLETPLELADATVEATVDVLAATPEALDALIEANGGLGRFQLINNSYYLRGALPNATLTVRFGLTDAQDLPDPQGREEAWVAATSEALAPLQEAVGSKTDLDDPERDRVAASLLAEGHTAKTATKAVVAAATADE